MIQKSILGVHMRRAKF